jgi:hypothetical protein
LEISVNESRNPAVGFVLGAERLCQVFDLRA